MSATPSALRRMAARISQNEPGNSGVPGATCDYVVQLVREYGRYPLDPATLTKPHEREILVRTFLPTVVVFAAKLLRFCPRVGRALRARPGLRMR